MSVHKYSTAKGDKWYVKYGNHTKRGFKLKHDAMEYEAKLRLQNPSCDNPLYFFVVINEYLNSERKRLSYGTYIKKEAVCKKIFFIKLKNKDMRKMSELDCKEFKELINESNYSTRHKNYILNLYKEIFRYAKIYFKLKNDPTYVLINFKKSYEEKLKDRQKETNIWTEDELLKFLKCVNKPTYKALFLTLYYTGLRLGEALALNWNDFSGNTLSISKSLTRKSENHTYEIKEPKNMYSIRTILIGDNLSKYLNQYKETQMKVSGFNNQWFIFGNVNPLPYTSISRIKDKAIKEAHVKNIRIHDFRHSHASLLISKGLNIVAISRRLGHSDVNTTLKIYTHLLQENEKQLVSYLDKSSQKILKVI